MSAARTGAVRLRRWFVAGLAALSLTVLGAGPALAYEPVNVVHTERVQAGPYTVDVGFSTWPVRALQSLDFTFAPEGGIAGKNGTLVITGPGQKGRPKPLVRHPRKLDVWGLDITALDDPGTYAMTFAVDGPRGRGVGTLPGLVVVDQPGPPLSLSWVLGSLPFVGLVVLLAVAWRRTRPARHRLLL